MEEFKVDTILNHEIDSEQGDALEFSAHLAWRALNETDEESAEQHQNAITRAGLNPISKLDEVEARLDSLNAT